MDVPLPVRRLLARRRCIKELQRLAVSLDSVFTGTPMEMETPDGQLTDEVGGDELLDAMYMIQEHFIGGLSFWPHVDVRALLHRTAAEAGVISKTFPPPIEKLGGSWTFSLRTCSNPNHAAHSGTNWPSSPPDAFIAREFTSVPICAART